jgi:flagellar hook-length control protein FliK
MQPATLSAASSGVAETLRSTQRGVTDRLAADIAERALAAVERQVRISIAQGGGRATIDLDPAELGRIEVQLVRSGEEMTVSFKVQHAAVKDLIEASLGRLRDSLASAGLALTDTDVQTGQGQEQPRDSRDQAGALVRGGAQTMLADELVPGIELFLDEQTSLVDLRV